ncbi:XdhC family protein [Aquabacterium sp.]|uniref:XdhC family protein n=1 Tax=Aquabacterium sp. TaxID=1872578 RepID=UPI003D6D9486
MENMDQQLLTAVRRWAQCGHRVALVTVAQTWGSSPRPAGAWMALRDDGLVEGSVSGGCIEDDLIAQMKAGQWRDEAPFLLSYGVTKDEAHRFGLPCGGTVQLVVEPTLDLSLLQQLEQRVRAGQLAQRTIDLPSGQVTVGSGQRGLLPAWDGRTLITQHGPQWRLLIIGAGQISRYLAPMAQALGYEVTMCDPRPEFNAPWNVPGALHVAGMPDDAVIDMAPDLHSAVVALTHDPKLDDLALMEALKSPAFYVGALGSRLNNDQRRDRLRLHFDLTQEEVDSLHGPVGLAIGSKTPPEIAVSILAHMTCVKRGHDQPIAADRGVRHPQSGVSAPCQIN